MNLQGLFEPEAEQRFREAAAHEKADDADKVKFDSKSTALISIAVSLRKLTLWLEKNNIR